MKISYSFDPFAPFRRPQSERETHLEALLDAALPYLERVELGTQTSPTLRKLVDDIR
jgi:dihydroorotase